MAYQYGIDMGHSISSTGLRGPNRNGTIYEEGAAVTGILRRETGEGITYSIPRYEELSPAMSIQTMEVKYIKWDVCLTPETPKNNEEATRLLSRDY